LLGEFYRPLFEAGVNADFAHPGSDLSRYRLVVVPALYLVSDAAADNVRRYVEGGGTALITFFSGIVDPCDRVRLGGYPAPWCELLGLRVEELAPLADGVTVLLEGRGETAGGGVACDGVPAAGRLWQDVIDLRGAAPLLTFGEGHLAGIAAATEHEYGQGRAFYLGTLPDRATLGGLVRRVCGHAGIELVTGLPRGVEAIRRGEYLFLISHVDQPVEIDIGARRLDRLSSAVVGPRAVLAPRGVLVLGSGPADQDGAVPEDPGQLSQR
jgi:beta-galactosidase